MTFSWLAKNNIMFCSKIQTLVCINCLWSKLNWIVIIKTTKKVLFWYPFWWQKSLKRRLVIHKTIHILAISNLFIYDLLLLTFDCTQQNLKLNYFDIKAFSSTVLSIWYKTKNEFKHRANIILSMRRLLQVIHSVT